MATIDTVNAQYLAVLRTTAPPAFAASVAAQIDNNTLTDAEYVQQLVTAAQQTTVPALSVYDFFFGATPSSAGLDFLTNFSSTLESNQGFSLINTYVNMAASDGMSSSSFAASYDSMDRLTFFDTVYTQIFGHGPSQAAIDQYFTPTAHTLPNGQTVTLNAFDYYELYVQESNPPAGANLEDGARGAVVGTLLYLAEQDPTTVWSKATGNYLTQLAQFAGAHGSTTGFPGYGEELLSNFGVPTITTFTLTVGQDSFTTGSGNDVYNAPLAGVFGDQSTLTNGDTLTDSGQNNTLNATFDGSATVTGLTIAGIQTWNIQNVGTFGTVSLQGALSGVTSLTYNDSGGGSSLFVGSPLGPISLPTGASAGFYNGFTLTVQNALGGGSGAGHAVDLAFGLNALSGTDTINVNAQVVGNHGDNDLNDAYGIAAGYAGSGGNPAVGFQTWNLSSTGAAVGTVNDIALGGEGSTTATTLNITDDGSTTIVYASNASGSHGAADWANVTTIDASGTTGQLTVTGAETHSNSHGAGFLADDATALTTVLGGTGADLFDLSGYAGTKTQVAGLTIDGGGNDTDENSFGDTGTGVELSGTEINAISTEYAGTSGAFAEWTGVPILYDIGSSNGGAINMADFGGTLTVTLLNGSSLPFGIEQTSDFTITNAPDNFTFNFNNTNQDNNDFSITGVAGTDTVTVNYGQGTFAPFDVNSTGEFVSQNIDNVDINIVNLGGHSTFYSGGILAFANSGDAETLTIDASGKNDGSGIDVGNVHTGELGVDTITLLGGTLDVIPLPAHWSETGTLDIGGVNDVTIGVTNASVIDSTTSGEFDMTSPDDIVAPGSVANWTAGTGVEVSATSDGSLLQGSLSQTGTSKGFPLLVTGEDSLTDLAGDSSFFGDGGPDTINIGHTADTSGNSIFFGTFELNDNPFDLPIEAGGQAGMGFWGAAFAGQVISGTGDTIFGTDANGGTSADVTTVTGFTVGLGNTDQLNFNDAAWGSNFTGSGQLVTGNLTHVTTGNADATMQLVTSAGTTLANGTNLVIDGIGGTFANAAALAASLNGAGDVQFGANLGHHGVYDMLFAYQNTGGTISIADVEFVNTNGSGTSGQNVSNGAGIHVYASDMVTGIVGSLNDLSVNSAAIHFSHTV